MDNEIKKDVEIVEQDHEQPKEERLFTQAEVTEIVKKRLKRAEEKSTQRDDAAFQEREMALNKKESYLKCKEYLLSNNMPTDLLDAFDTSDFEQFENKIGIVQRYVKKNTPVAPLGTAEPAITNKAPGAFSPDYKHEPKKFGY